MREILFKAKTKMIVGTYNCGKEDGEWVVGQLYCDVGKWVIRQFEFDRADYVDYEVDPDTVCQYTGLTDKNGKKIFEGDILQGHGNKNELCNVVLGGFYIIDVETLEKVEYVNGWHTEVIPTDALSKTEPFCLDMPLSDFYIERSEFEVISNIFDNPELLSKQEVQE